MEAASLYAHSPDVAYPDAGPSQRPLSSCCRPAKLTGGRAQNNWLTKTCNSLKLCFIIPPASSLLINKLPGLHLHSSRIHSPSCPSILRVARYKARVPFPGSLFLISDKRSSLARFSTPSTESVYLNLPTLAASLPHPRQTAHAALMYSTRQPFAPMPLTLHDIPEEILERIFALVLVQSPEPSPRPSWHLYQTPPTPRHPNIISPLLVCRSWLRIATPVHYRHPVLRTPRHAELLLRALRHTPSLAPCIRSLHVHATSPALRDIVPLCYNLDTLDITVDTGDSAQVTVATGLVPAAGEAPRGSTVVDFCEAFMKTRSIRHLVIRKNAYLTHSNAIHVFEQLAKAISRWPKLVSTRLAYAVVPASSSSLLCVRAVVECATLHGVRLDRTRVARPPAPSERRKMATGLLHFDRARGILGRDVWDTVLLRPPLT